MATSGAGVGSVGGVGAGAIRAGAAFVELFLKDASLSKSLKAAEQKFRTAAAAMQKVGTITLGAGLAVTTPLVGAFKGAIDRGSEFNRLAQKLGDSTEALSAFSYAAQTTGVNMDGLLDDFENWPDRLSKAASGTDELSATFRTLGLDAQKMARLPLTEQMVALSEAIAKIPNPTAKLKLLGDLFSDKGQNLGPLLSKGPAAIRALMKEAGDVGSVVKSEDAQRAAQAGRAIDRAWTAVKNTFLEVGAAILPEVDSIEKLSRAVVNVLKDARQWISENQTLVLTVAGVGAALTAAGAAFIGIGSVLSAASVAAGGFLFAFGVVKATVLTVAGAIGSALGLLISPVGLVVAAAGALAFLGATQTATGRAGVKAFGDWASGVKAAVTETALLC